MRKILLLTLLVFSSASIGLGQEKYHKIEVSGGYSIMMANGIVGDGDVFSTDKDDLLVPNQDLNTAFPTGTASNFNLADFFPKTPISFSGKKHRASLHGFNASAVYNISKYYGLKFEMSGNYRANDVQAATPLALEVFVKDLTAIPLPATAPAPNYFRGLLVYPGFGSRTSQKNYNYLGGLQIKNNSPEKKFKPFAHALAGLSQQTVKLKDFTDNGNNFDRANDGRKIYGTDKISNTGFAMEFGGGIDIRLSKRIDLRVIQIDYNPVKIKEKQILEFKKAFTGINIPNTLTITNSASPDFTQYSPYDLKVRSRWQNNFRIGVGIVFH